MGSISKKTCFALMFVALFAIISFGLAPLTDDDSSATDNMCKEDNAFISDQYSVFFKGQQLIPNGYAARFVLYEK